MSLYAVFRSATVQSFHCSSEPYHWPLANTSEVNVEVCTRHGRLFKRLEGARKLSTSVGGFVKDLATGKVVFDARS